MCGISGFLFHRATLPRAAAESRLWAMIATLRHRGPDDEGVWTDGQAGLAHARLSVIDLSPAGHQPMASADETAWITYNGEIYNFAEIRQELGALGYPFRSRSDTEVLVNGWHAWGPKIFSRLRGMFALAIWERRSRRLILARDRIGKKPLYYSATAEAFLFGSEIKALLAWPGMPRVPDLSAVDRYLTLGYVPAPYTALAGVRKLPAAHYLVVEARPGGGLTQPEFVRYWRLPSPRAERQHRGIADLQRELVAHLEDAVRLRLVSDVPLGAFLSGGVDSSAVVAMMSRVGGGTVKTFSIGFSAKQYDETRYARMVAERYATDHQELVVEPVGDPDLLRLRNGTSQGDRRAQRRWRGRELPWLQPVQGDAPCFSARQNASLEPDRAGAVACSGAALGPTPVQASPDSRGIAGPRGATWPALLLHDRFLYRLRQGERLRRGAADPARALSA